GSTQRSGDRRHTHARRLTGRPAWRHSARTHRFDGVRPDRHRASRRGGRARARRLVAAVRAPALRRSLGVGQMSDRYTIISADAHAGLPCAEYRPYLDQKYHDAFDAFLNEKNAERELAMKLNYEYITNWETTHEEGLRGAYDAEQRDKEMDADGVAAEVMFADADAITGMESPPFGAGLSAGTVRGPQLPVARSPPPDPRPA